MSLNRASETTHTPSIHEYNKAFTFDWQNYKSIKNNEDILPQIAMILANPQALKLAFNADEQHELAELCYKTATFYNHIKRNPDLALPLLEIAQDALKGSSLAWVQNHLAFSYQQKLAAAKKKNNFMEVQEFSKNALLYCAKAKLTCKDTHSLSNIKIIAFSHCVEALAFYEMGHMKDALSNYKFALNLYEENNALDDQYARAKNRWAMMLAEDNRLEEALNAFKQLEHYWESQNDKSNPYPARFYVSYGEFLTTKMEKGLAQGLEKFKIAHEILCQTEGKEAKFTNEIQERLLTLETILKGEKSPYSPKLYTPNSTLPLENEVKDKANMHKSY